MGCGPSKPPTTASPPPPPAGVAASSAGDDATARQGPTRIGSGAFGRSTRSGSIASSSMPSARDGVGVLSSTSGDNHSFGSPNGTVGAGVVSAGDTPAFMLSEAEMRDLRRTIEQRDPSLTITAFSVPLPRRDRHWPLGGADGSSSYKSVSFGCKVFAVELRREGKRLVGSRSKVRFGGDYFCFCFLGGHRGG